MSCQSGSAVIASGSPVGAPPSGELTVTTKLLKAPGASRYASNNYNAAKSNTAGVMEPGGNPDSTSDFSIVGMFTSGPMVGQFYVIDGYLSTALPYDWWNCGHETGGYRVHKLTSTNEDPYPTTDPNPENSGFMYIGSLCGVAVRNPNTGNRAVVGNNLGAPKLTDCHA
jgi:hypothetical protein